MTVKPLMLPALRGSFGSWIYYTCLIPIRELGQRVSYADQLQKSPELSALIQRALEGPRAFQISKYLSSTPERFFNSLVLATYGGDPKWLEIGDFRSVKEMNLIDLVPDDLADSIGFLQFSGKEKIFAIDGQHRLAGIKRAIEESVPLDDDVVPILVVGHKTSVQGLQRTRRLFTTLNKTAVPVRKRDIIALDEDDVMAIIARRMVETDARFTSPKIGIISSTSLPASSDGMLTVISNLYDLLKRLFMFQLDQKRDTNLRFNRPTDADLDIHFQFALGYFTALSKSFPPVGQLLRSLSPEKLTPKYRHARGGHILFRPVGLEVITRIAIEYAKHHKVDLESALVQVSKLPTDLGKRPYRDTIWDEQRKAINLKGRDMALELCRHMMDLPTRRPRLGERYRTYLGDDAAKLPPKVV